MAVTLTIVLSDEEQAKLTEIASMIHPGATPAQIKKWAEKKAKAGLRRIVTLELADHQYSSMDAAWPGEEIIMAPEQVPDPVPEQI